MWCGGQRLSFTAIRSQVPLAKGGSNEDDNLWTLCDHCNLGKSDTVL
jgi:5-methylcytosine-specific restriction endonuclease McrA